MQFKHLVKIFFSNLMWQLTTYLGLFFSVLTKNSWTSMPVESVYSWLESEPKKVLYLKDVLWFLKQHNLYSKPSSQNGPHRRNRGSSMPGCLWRINKTKWITHRFIHLHLTHTIQESFSTFFPQHETGKPFHLCYSRSNDILVPLQLRAMCNLRRHGIPISFIRNMLDTSSSPGHGTLYWSYILQLTSTLCTCICFKHKFQIYLVITFFEEFYPSSPFLHFHIHPLMTSLLLCLKDS